MINKVYLKTKAGVDILVGLDAKEVIKAIEENGDTQPYIFYKDGEEFYMAVKNLTIGPLKFPNPGPAPKDYGTTSSELYAKTVTYPETVSRIIQIQTRAKPSLMDQIKKVMTLATPIVALSFIIFIMAVALKG